MRQNINKSSREGFKTISAATSSTPLCGSTIQINGESVSIEEVCKAYKESLVSQYYKVELHLKSVGTIIYNDGERLTKYKLRMRAADSRMTALCWMMWEWAIISLADGGADFSAMQKEFSHMQGSFEKDPQGLEWDEAKCLVEFFHDMATKESYLRSSYKALKEEQKKRK